MARAVKQAVPPGTRIVLGSGAGIGGLDRFLEAVDTVIVGSHVKVDGDAARRPDPLRAKAFIEHAAERGLV